MPADEVTHGTDVEESRVRTGPRHAAPRKPLFTRFQMPAGKVIAIAAMPTAVLMGMGFTPTLAQADDHSTSKSLTAEEYQACVEAVTGEEASDTASPSASASASASSDQATPSPSASSDSTDKDTSSSSDSGSDDKAEPTASPSASATTQEKAADSAASTPTPSATESSKNPLDPLGVGDAIKDILTPDETASSTPAPSASASASADAGSDTSDDKGAADTVKDTTDKVAETVEDTTDKVTDTASKAASDTTETVEDEAAEATATPSPSASATTDAADCPVATDDKGGVDNQVALPTDPWYLNASSLLLKGADYQGIVKVRTADGTVKKVLKYVISDGTDIGDLHQTVNDKQSGKTYHVQAASGSTSTIRDGKTIMYTESISGNLLGLIPVTFDPDNPPPLNIPLIYFTKVKVVQAGQFGGTLHVPGLHQYTTG
uniref:Membrane-bound hydrophilic protein n=1 Tax=Streptomyces sp. NBC_01393 TaxID=2903851 RepID=A0AAU3I1S4_9ACTN